MPTGKYPRRPYTPRSNKQRGAEVSPTVYDLYWAAGLYEGEGSIGGTTISVNQKDPWVIWRLQRLFGGTTAIYQSGTPRCDIWNWSISGSRARGFIYTIYSLLSPRRQLQVQTAKLRPGVLGPIKNTPAESGERSPELIYQLPSEAPELTNCTTCGHEFRPGEDLSLLPYCCHRHWGMWKGQFGV